MSVDRAAYNAFVQQVQREAASWGMETRVRYDRLNEQFGKAYFEVYWGGWRVLASEYPFVPDEEREMQTDEMGWIKLQAEMARELVKS